MGGRTHILEFMAQRAIASTGQKDTETAAFASLTAADIIRAPIVQRRIPVDFRPLLKPFKSAGRLCLRIERMPQGAKLSAGRRGTDNSWSLASDELEDLDYLISSNIARDHELTVRVMTFEDGAALTLKVMQFAVSANDGAPLQPERELRVDEPVLRSQLGEMHSLFAVRESELVELRAALERVTGEKEAELIKARSEWERELDRKIADAVAQSRSDHGQKEQAREADRKEKAAQDKLRTEQRIAAELERAKEELERRSEIERQKWQSEAEQHLRAARKEWQAEADGKLEAARKAWQAESDERQKSELENLKADGEKRVEAERRKWRAQSDERTAKEREGWTADADQKLEAARQAWQAESDERFRIERENWAADGLKRIEAEREAWQTQARDQWASELVRWKADADRQLETARQAWQADADERRRVDIDGWKADTDKRVEDERQRWLAKASEQDRADFERERAEVEARIHAERQTWQAEADEQSRKDRLAWEAEAEQRMEAARQACRADADAHLSAECARLEVEMQQWAQAERQRLESEIRAAVLPAAEVRTESRDLPPAAASEADQETVQRLVEERDKNRQLNAALVAQADKVRDMELALAAMTERCETAERAAPAGEKPPATESEDGYIKGLRAEIVTLRRSITNQAAELGRARGAGASPPAAHSTRSGKPAAGQSSRRLRGRGGRSGKEQEKGADPRLHPGRGRRYSPDRVLSLDGCLSAAAGQGRDFNRYSRSVERARRKAGPAASHSQKGPARPAGQSSDSHRHPRAQHPCDRGIEGHGPLLPAEEHDGHASGKGRKLDAHRSASRRRHQGPAGLGLECLSPGHGQLRRQRFSIRRANQKTKAR